jgi:hypothetical protein
VILLVVGHPERSSSSIDTRPALKLECHSKTTVHLKECSPKSLMKHFKGFGNRFIELHAKLDVDTLLGFVIHRGQNETQSRKSTHVKQCGSQCGGMWQTDAIGLQ